MSTKVLAACGQRFIAQINDEDYLMVNLDEPSEYLYAWDMGVFLRFNPYFDSYNDQDGRIADRVNDLFRNGKLKKTKENMVVKIK